MTFSLKNTLRFIITSPLKICSVGVALCLFLSYLSYFISPEKLWYIAFFGLLFQLFFISNLLLLLFWGLFRKKIAWMHAIVLLPSVFFISSFIQLFNNIPEVKPKPESLKVISYNVQMFQLPYKKHDSTYMKIAAYLNSENADVICLQEFYTEDKKLDENTFRHSLKGIEDSHILYGIKKAKSRYGIAIFSRYPILSKGDIMLSETGNVATYVDLDVNGETVRVYNSHLQSIRLNLPKSMNRILNQDKKRVDEILDISLRIKTAFVKRAEQVDAVSKHIRQSPYPVIVCGDFNDTPVSYTYQKMKRGLKDAFRQAGQGMPSTHRSFFPSFRIDYILHNRAMQTASYEVSEVEYSDHHPIVAEINIKE